MSTEIQELLLENDEPPGNSLQWNDWRWQLTNSISDLNDLKILFSFDKTELENLKAVTEKYPFAVTPYYLSVIDKVNPLDPVRLQCLSSAEEERFHLEVHDDPLGEEKDSVLPGLVHHYSDISSKLILF